MQTLEQLNQRDVIEQLKKMHFCGPFGMAQRRYMVYQGKLLALPDSARLTVAQIRAFIGEVDRIVSPAEWEH